MILLDTHVMVWLLTARARISDRAHSAIMQARRTGEKIVYSPVSLYEIAYSARRNRLPLNSPVEDFIAALQTKLEMVPLTAEILVRAAGFPDSFHGDPMDRIITATSIVEGCTLITKDEKIRAANVCKVLW
jgi:PIN domain nuclease of toxin-antitoxin system